MSIRNFFFFCYFMQSNFCTIFSWTYQIVKIIKFGKHFIKHFVFLPGAGLFGRNRPADWWSGMVLPTPVEISTISRILSSTEELTNLYTMTRISLRMIWTVSPWRDRVSSCWNPLTSPTSAWIHRPTNFLNDEKQRRRKKACFRFQKFCKQQKITINDMRTWKREWKKTLYVNKNFNLFIYMIFNRIFMYIYLYSLQYDIAIDL